MSIASCVVNWCANVVEEVEYQKEIRSRLVWWPVKDLSEVATKVAKREVRVVWIERALCPEVRIVNGVAWILWPRYMEKHPDAEWAGALFHEIGHLVIEPDNLAGKCRCSLESEVSADAFAVAAGHGPALAEHLQTYLGRGFEEGDLRRRIAIVQAQVACARSGHAMGQ